MSSDCCLCPWIRSPLGWTVIHVGSRRSGAWTGLGPCFTLAVAASLCAIREARNTPKPFERADRTQLQNGRP